MKIKRFLTIGLALLIIAASLPISAMLISAESTSIGVLADGGFEKGTTLFNSRTGRVKNDNAFEGRYIVDCKNKTLCSSEFTLQAGLRYKVSFWYLNETSEENEIFGVTSDLDTSLLNRVADAYATLTETADWKCASFEFTANKTEYMLYVKGNFKLDAVTIYWEEENSIIQNGSFEDGIEGWNSNTSDNPIKAGNAATGFVYAELPVNKNGGIYCDFNVNRNTNYTVSFDYLGGGASSAFAVTKTSGTAALNNAVSEVKGFTATTDWAKTSLTFNSGNSTRLRLFIRSGEYGTLSVDNVRINVADSSNLIANGSFENGADGFTVSGGTPDVSDITLSGEKSLAFPTSETTVYQKITVEKNKDYIIRFNRSDAVTFAIAKGSLSAPVFTGDDVIIGSTLAKNNGAWSSEKFDFNSGENTSLLIAFKGVSSALDDICVIENAFNPEKNLILKNGGFENGLTGWEMRWAGSIFTLSKNSASGENALSVKGGSYNRIGHSFPVEKGKSYRVVFSYSGKLSWNKWSVTSGGAANRFNVDEGTPGYVIGGMVTCNNTAYTSAVSEVFTAAEDDTYYFNIGSSTSTDIDGLFDDIYIFEINGASLILNGDFDGVLSPWSYDSNAFEQEMSGYNNSPASLKATSAYYSKASQQVNVEANTNYELTFWYKGNPSASVSAYAVSTGISFSDADILSKGKLVPSNEWKKVSTVVNSGELTSLYILFQTANDGEYMIDNVAFTKTTKTATPKANLTPAYFGGLASAYITDSQNNIIQNGDFEGGQSGTKPDALNLENTVTEIVNDNGGKALKFEVGSSGGLTMLPLGLEKNTKYQLTLYVKTPKMSDSNSCDVSFGIADSDTGEFIITATPDSEADRLWKTERQLVPTAADDKWHITSCTFDTNDAENLVFMIRGTNAVVYLDNIYIFKPEHQILWESDFNKIDDITVTDTAPALLGSKTPADNLIENFNFESSDISEWENTRGTVYGDTLKIVDSDSSIYGNSFYYKSNRRYPRNIYYIKWIDVEPNTEYTFSAKCSLTSVGNGYFGLISGYKSGDDIAVTNENLKHPTVIKRFRFEEAAYDEACNWQTIGTSFNTNDRNRVGVVVFDGGGEAYIDEIRLFKTSAAAALPTVADNFPKNLVAKNLDFSGGKITVTAGEKISDTLKKFENNSYIRVFGADGKEITDKYTALATGMEFRLMDGPVIKDRATVIVRGDVNGDGKADNTDKSLIVKHLSKESIIEEPYDLAADYDGDGKVTVYDLMQKRTAPSKGSVNLEIEGPKTFAAGEDIEVSIVADADNLSALNGVLKFGNNSLTFKSAAAELDGWEVSTLEHGDSLYFAACDVSGKNPSDKNKAVITLTLTVGNVATYDEVQIFLTEAYASSMKALLTAEEYMWTPNGNTVQNNPNQGTNTENKVETIIENVKLSVLKLDEAEISPEFDPEIKEYTAKVPFSVKKVTVTAVAADENAKVEIGDTNLEYVGKNMVKVVVTTENGSKATYRIIVERGKPDKTDADTDVSYMWLLWIIIPVAALLIIAGIVLFIILKKRKNK